jgi:hypothetical protein
MSTQSTHATLVSFRSLTDCTVRLATGEEVKAVMDAPALRKRHGPIYNIRLGGAVEVEHDTPHRIVAIEQSA